MASMAAAPFIGAPLVEAAQVNSTKNFTFQWNGRGALPPSQILTISLLDADTGLIWNHPVNAIVVAADPWLTAAPISGNTVFTSQISINSAARNLGLGTYRGQIQVISGDPVVVNSPQFASVTLNISRGKP